jgi:acetaldehyde dehydrogenase (acetylating)
MGGTHRMIQDKDLLSIQEARDLARAAKNAQQILANFDEEQIDKIIKSMVEVAVNNSERLAKMAVEETGFGKVEDKILKNLAASKDLYEYIKDMKTIGIIKNDTVNKVLEIAEPVGTIVGIIPSTNPTSTAIFKSIISIKSRNGIVIAPHPSAVNCTYEASKLMAEAAVKAGAPEGIIGCIKIITIEASEELMKCPETSLILATGGPGMVKAAYSSGKPALGVGPGNVPAYIERSANIEKAVSDIIISKTFDNSTICASEQAIIVEECIREDVIKALKSKGAYFMNEEETKIVGDCLISEKGAMNASFVGRSAEVIAEKVGISIPKGTTVLIGEQLGVGKGYPLSYEKLTCVLAFYTVKDWEEACHLSIKLLKNGGLGHSMSIHSQNEEIIMKFAAKPVSRILVNTPSSLGGVGLLTGLAPSFTLGCGAMAGSATSDNVTPLNLINIKRVAYGIKDFVRPVKAVSCDDKSTCSDISSINASDIANIVANIISKLK